MMSKSKEKNILAKLSQEIGSNPAYVQGGGGNISIKYAGHEMAIKSSGELLKNLTETNGFSLVNYKEIRDYLNQRDTYDDFEKTIQSFTLDTKNRPSMETGFHALLDTVTIHTHSVYANVLTCSEEGKHLISTLFPSAIWVDYTTPGKDLTLKIKGCMSELNEDAAVLFLQNHGIIVSAKTPEAALLLHEDVNTKIKDYFDIPEASFSQEDDYENDAFMNDHILFPDQVIYTLAGEALLKTLGAKEICWSYYYIYNTIQRLSLTPRFLPKREADILLNMESEKRRQRQIIS